MKSLNNKMSDLAPTRWVIVCLCAVTLYFQINLADPFNSPKMWILIIVAAWLVGYLFSFSQIIFSHTSLKHLFYIILFFVFSISLATVFTDFKYVALLGDTQRRNGLLTYIALSILLVSSSVFFRTFNINRLILATVLVSIFTSSYGVLQTTGNDFVNWINPHNSLIGTQGNPNFAASAMAVMGIIIFSATFVSNVKFYQRVILYFIAIVLLVLILRSNARQGLLVYVLGVGMFITMWLFGKRKSLGVIALITGSLLLVISVLGMLQIGPLEKFLYKSSVSVRGFYWRAGFEMFLDHPLLGVGIDRYGAYFMQYRELEYSNRFGYEITSSNAHNTFIQFFATGGVLLGTSYLLLLFFILRRGLVGFGLLKGDDRVVLAGLISAWVGFQSQSLISIDNVGISVWGWVLGGAIVGLSVSNPLNLKEDKLVFSVKKNSINLKQIFISTPLVLITILLISMLYRGENNAYKSVMTFNPQNQDSVLLFKKAQLLAVSTPLMDPQYKLRFAQNLVGYGFVEEGISVLKIIHKNDPRNLDAINLLSKSFEVTNRIPEAIVYQEKLIKLNQWSAPTYLALGRNYKTQGDLMRSREILNKLISFATGIPGEPIIEQAKKELLS